MCPPGPFMRLPQTFGGVANGVDVRKGLGSSAAMSDLRIQRPDGDDALKDWQHVHNTIIPTHLLSLEEVRERAQRHHLEVAYSGDELIGCSTVRPPADDTLTVTVIARVLEAHRGQGSGRSSMRAGSAGRGSWVPK